MKDYCRVMLGRKSAHARECFNGSFLGTDSISVRTVTRSVSS